MYRDKFCPDKYDGEICQPYLIKKPDAAGSPAVLFLHGAGERGDDNCAQLKIGLNTAMADESSPLYGAMIIAPQCPLERLWVAVDWHLGCYSRAETPETPELKTAVELFRSKCAEFSCDMNRLYVMGISMGGFGTWDCLARYPSLFAAGFPCCGAGDTADAGILRDMPIYAFHGELDCEVPPSGSRDMTAAIRAAGGTKIKYKEYPGVYHDSWNLAYGESELIAEMFGQVKKNDAK